MKRLKNIFSLLLLIAIIPCWVSSCKYNNDLEDLQEEDGYFFWADEEQEVDWSIAMTEANETLDRLPIVIFVFCIAASSIAHVLHKKHYAGLVSGALSLVPFLTFFSCVQKIRKIERELTDIMYSKSLYPRAKFEFGLNEGSMRTFVLLLGIPSVGLILIGLWEIYQHRKQQKNAPDPAAPVYTAPAQEALTPPPSRSKPDPLGRREPLVGRDPLSGQDGRAEREMKYSTMLGESHPSQEEIVNRKEGLE